MYQNKQRRVTTGTVRVSSESKWPARQALWLVLASAVIVLAVLVFSRWYVGLIAWQLRRFGWYLPTATPALLVLVPVALVLGLTWRMLARAMPADATDLARRLARALALLAALAGGVTLVIAYHAWAEPSDAPAWPRQTLAAIEARGDAAQGPVTITEATADPARIAVLREDTPAFAGETAYVLLHHADGTPSRILAEAVPDPHPPYRRVIRRGYLVAHALPDPVLARLSGETRAPVLVLWAHPREIGRAALVAALQALAFTMVLALAACIAAQRAKRLRTQSESFVLPHCNTGHSVTNSP